MRIIVSGKFFTQSRQGGRVDVRMAYVLGFQRLGHEVYVMVDVNRNRCVDKAFKPVSFDQWDGNAWFEDIVKSYGVWPRFCVIYEGGKATYGMTFQDAVRIAKTADLLINISGELKTPEVVEAVRCRAYIDQDPAKNQVYYTEYGDDFGVNRHEHFFTVGMNIGRPGCEIPTCGVTWHPIAPPIVLDRWPARIDESCPRFTTISSWAGKRTFKFEGKFSGEKADQWRTFIELPKRTSQELEIALNIDRNAYPEDLRLFEDNGWKLVDPKRLQSFECYRDYIAASRGEFSIANHRYVLFKTGWISDRTARYLACGKPVLVQQTGLESHFPIGKGLLAFSTLEDAIENLDAINRDYLDHCHAARRIAEEHFDSDRVLTGMLRAMGF